MLAERVPVRREPPRWRPVTLQARAEQPSGLVRLSFVGPELDDALVAQPASSVRLLLPDDAGALEIPTWRGNEFLRGDSTRPTIRTLTPLRADATGELALEVVLHDNSPLTRFATSAPVGAEAAISGPGRGYAIDADARAFVLLGDDSARPAMEQLLPLLPEAATAEVVIADSAALPDLATGLAIGPDARVWAAGEAAAMQRLRKHLFEERGLPRSQCTVRGYWKRGEAGDDGEP